MKDDGNYNQPIPYVMGSVDVTRSPFFGLSRSDAALVDTGIFVNVEFERGILQLAALTGHRDIHQLVESFNRWCATTVFSWQVALDYCIDRARAGKSLPWEVNNE